MAWIALARAKFGKTAETRTLEAYEIAKEAARLGIARFVLSGTNHYETQLRDSFDSRLDVVEVMAELSRFHVIRRPHQIVPTEMKSAISEIMGLPHNSKPLPFGVGVSAMWDYPFEDMSPQLMLLQDHDCEPLGLTPRVLELFSAYPQHANDILLLAGRDRRIFEQDKAVIQTLRSLDKDYVDRHSLIESEIASNPKLSANIKEVVAGASLSELKEEIVQGCLALGINPTSLIERLAGDPSNYLRMLRLLKSRWVAYKMELLIHRQQHRQWSLHDLHDVIALSVAIPYCDVVVTENQWRHLAKTENLDREYNTRVVSPSSMREEFARL